jgi:hypothetical protein
MPGGGKYNTDEQPVDTGNIPSHMISDAVLARLNSYNMSAIFEPTKITGP